MNKKAYGFVIALVRKDFYGKEKLTVKSFEKKDDSEITSSHLELLLARFKLLKSSETSDLKIAKKFYYTPRCTHVIDSYFLEACADLNIRVGTKEKHDDYYRMSGMPVAYNWYEILRTVAYNISQYTTGEHGLISWEIVRKELKNVINTFNFIDDNQKENLYKVFEKFIDIIEVSNKKTSKVGSYSGFVLTESHYPQTITLDGYLCNL